MSVPARAPRVGASDLGVAMRPAPVLARLPRFLVVVLGLAAAGLAALAPPSVRAEGAVQAASFVAIASEIEADAGETRLVFTLNAPVQARAFAIARPDRIVLDLPSVNFQLSEASARSGGLVAGMRYGVFAADRSRVVIELAGPARVAEVATTPRADGAHLLTIRLAPIDAAVFAAAVAADAQAFREASLRPALDPSPAPGDGRPTIVIDPGHGGIDPGAVAAGGVHEADVVLAFSRRLRERLEESGRFRVLMTRDADVFVALTERVAFARRAQADLFVSIHADSLSSAPQVSGLTVYTNADTASDSASATLAARENQVDAVAGLETEAAQSDVADILRDLTMRETRGYSHVVASKLVTGMAGVARLNKNPHRQAGFVVLRAHDVPSVLVELGYLSSRRDIALLTSDAWRDGTTQAMSEAIERFFAPRAAGRIEANAAVSP